MFKNLLYKRFGVFVLFAVTMFALTSLPLVGLAQTSKLPRSGEPRRDLLLNGLRTITIYQPSSQQINFRLRIHYGSAFDPSGKEGLMQMFAESLFSDEQRNAFRELDGDFSVKTGYDFVEFQGSGNAENFVSLLDIFREAIANYAPTTELVKLLRQKQIAKINALNGDAAYLVESAVTSRLFGTFPYGRSAEGTPETIAKIDRADLILARERFLKSDFATFAFVGGVSPQIISRATKQLLGSWQKSEKVIPATFTLAPNIETEPYRISTPSEKTSVRFGWRGVARNASDYYVSEILTRVWALRLNDIGSIENRARFLPGYFMLSLKDEVSDQTRPARPMEPFLKAIFNTPVGQEEFNVAKAALIADYSQKLSNSDELITSLLDADTYRLSSPLTVKSLETVSLSDVQKLYEKLTAQPRVWVVGKPAEAVK